MDRFTSAENDSSGRPLTGPLVARRQPWFRVDSFSRWIFVSLLYFVASWVGNALNRTPSVADIIWPANGVLLAFLLQTRRRFWGPYLVASIVSDVATHMYFGFPTFQASLFAAGNAIEVLVGAWLLTAPDGAKPDLARVRFFGRFVAYGVLLAPLVSSAFVEAVLALRSRQSGLLTVTSWFVSDMMGIAVVTPLVLAIDKMELVSLFRAKKRFETFFILAGLMFLSTIVFALDGLPVDFLLLPAILLAIFRLGRSGAAIGILLIAVPAVYMTERSHGAFALVRSGMFVHSFFILQCFLCVALVILYAVDAVLAERDRLEREMTAALFEADATAALDHITGLANRRTFDHRLSREWQNASRGRSTLSLLMIDVDQFKLYNDHYGHVAGDACLRAIASLLACAPMRSTDVVARYGGEEFALILPRASANGSAALAERIRQTVVDAQLPHSAYAPGVVTVSIGVATMRPSVGVDETLLIQHADRALYLAKKGGRNRVEALDEMEAWETA